MPIWAFQKRIIGNPTPEKAAFVSSFADCDELFVINQRFLRTRGAVMVSSTIGISDKNRLRKRTLILSEAIESWLPHAARAGSFHIGDDTDGRIFIPNGAFISRR